MKISIVRISINVDGMVIVSRSRNLRWRLLKVILFSIVIRDTIVIDIGLAIIFICVSIEFVVIGRFGRMLFLMATS